MVRKITTYSLLALLQVLMVLIAPVAATAPVTAPHAAQQQTLQTAEPADSVYVMDNGDAVLAYNNTNTDNSSLEFGANVTKGLVHVLATGQTESDMDAAMSLVMTPDGYTGNGSLTADSPNSLSNLNLDVSSVQNEQKANADVSLDATFDSGSSSMSTLGSVHTDGSLSVSGNSFSTKGTGSVKTTVSGSNQKLKYDLRETNNGFVLKGMRDSEISPYMARYWNTSEKAKQRLKTQYAMVSQQSGSSAKVTIDNYQFDTSGDKPRLNVQYHVKFTGLKDTLSKQIASSLKSSSSVSLSDKQVDSITTDIKKMRIDHITLGMNQQGGKTTVNWNVEIDNYDPALIDALKVMENSGSSSISQKSIDRMKTQVKAQKAANLEQSVTWTADVSHPSTGTTAVSAKVHYRTKHWRAYTQEMSDRGVKLGTSSVKLHAKSDGDKVTAHGSVKLKQKAMLSKITDSMLSSVSSTTGASVGNSGATKLVRTFKQSKFQNARVDMDVHSGTVTVEGGAQFDNMSALANVLGDSYGNANVADIVGRTNGNTTTTYVHVKGLVGENATKSDVRALAIANDDTKIYMAGEWNRSFPSMDTKDAATYLGVKQANAKQSKSKNDSGQPGFGIVVAIVALAGVALLARRD